MSRLQTLRASVARLIAGKSNDMSASALVRAGATLGAWQDALGGFVPREVNPYFYEALREAVGPIDGGINRLVTMDGIIRVEGGNDRITNLIATELMHNIAVNDLQSGLQAFYASQSNELYEQGFTVGEMVFDAKGRELIGLRVADSKGVYYRREGGTLQTWYRPPAPKRGARRDGTDQLEAVLRNRTQVGAAALLGMDYALLDAARLVYAVHQPEAASPYGVSVMRSLEFVAQVLLKMQNATGHVWDRYGDPPLQLTYKKTGNARLQQADLDKRRAALAAELAKVIEAKRMGNSADFVQAVGKDDDITIKAIGADGQVLEIEMPARHMMEQILAKFGLPAWMLGMQWSTAERMAEQQSEIVLQESRTRFEGRLPGLRKVVATWLRGRGITWKPGDWELVQELPRLQDMLKEAQADFLRAQTAMMQGRGAPPPEVAPAPAKRAKAHAQHRCKGAGDAEPWAEDDPSLPRIEARAVSGLLALWHDLRDTVFRVLKLPAAKGAKVGEEVFAFDVLAILQAIAEAEKIFIDAAGADEGPLLREAYRAWVRGLENAAAGFNVAAAVEETAAQMRTILRERGMRRVRNNVVRALRDDILGELSSGAYDGLNPRVVASLLAERFDAHDYDWERLARSEIAHAQSRGKEAQYQAMGIAHYDLVAAGDSCEICTSLAAGGPYPIGGGPMPVDDTHPCCRCSIVAHMEDEGA